MTKHIYRPSVEICTDEPFKDMDWDEIGAAWLADVTENPVES